MVCLMLVVAGAVAGGAGVCGGDEATSSLRRPADFAVSFSHRDATVAPRYHAEWRLTVARGGQGRIDFVPGYSGPGVPHYIERFSAPALQRDRLYTRLRTGGVLRSSWVQPRSRPIGGPIDTASILAAGRRYLIPPFAENGRAPLSPFVSDFRRLVPTGIWRSLQARRARYVRDHFGP